MEDRVKQQFLPWQKMTSGVLQGSVLGTVAFNFSMNNIVKWVTAVIWKSLLMTLRYSN